MPTMKVWAFLAVVLSFPFAGACSDGDGFTPEELSTLNTFRLTAVSLPPDESNLYADMPSAAKLGKRFFFETRFGGPLGPYNDGATNGSLGEPGESGKVACASCHELDRGGTDHRSLPGWVSLGAGYTGRNAPPVINAAFSPLWQFWDGRKDSLWSQALGPVESGVEANSTRLQVAHVIYDSFKADYESVFGQDLPMPALNDNRRFPSSGKPGDPAFDGMAETDQEAVNRVFANFGKAIAAYERNLTSLNFAPSAFDLYMDGDRTQLSPEAIRGAKIFVGRAGCTECHRGPLLTDFQFHNIGVPQEGEHVADPDDGRLAGIPKVQGDPFNRGGVFSDQPRSDHLVSLLPADAPGKALLDGRFKTPTLRNVGKTAPYMHDGVYQNLWDVVNHYNFGGGTGTYQGQRTPTVSPLLLDTREVNDLVAFLKSLSDGDPKPATDFPDFPEGLIAPVATP